MNRLLKYLILTLLWGCVAAYIYYAAGLARRELPLRNVKSVRIEIVDSSSMGYLVTAQKVGSWLQASKIKNIGAKIESVDLHGIEQLISAKGFVADVQASVTYQGLLNIRVSQYTPTVRLVVDGYDSYITPDGYIFAVPPASSVYVPVISGPYIPPVPNNFNGYIRDHIDTLHARIERQIAKLEGDKLPFYHRKKENTRNFTKLKRMRVKRQWWLLESAESFDGKVKDLREKKAKLRRLYRYQSRQIELGIETICEHQEQQRRMQKKLEKNYDDFMKLLTFVKSIEDDDFWSSEFVQIIARSTSSGAMELDIVPRSGRHTILFGRVEDIEQKLDKLLCFYRKGLRSAGWDNFSTIDIRYQDQVVCRK